MLATGMWARDKKTQEKENSNHGGCDCSSVWYELGHFIVCIRIYRCLRQSFPAATRSPVKIGA
jgi:hypothetical protein